MPLESEGDAGEATRVHTLLVVDDEVLIRIALVDYLSECGFSVLDADSAEEAIAILQKPDTQVDLVFSDVVMPGAVDGFGLAQWIGLNRPDVVIMLASGYAMKARMASDLCAEEHVMQKPYRLPFVAEKIRTVLKARSRPSEPS